MRAELLRSQHIFDTRPAFIRWFHSRFGTADVRGRPGKQSSGVSSSSSPAQQKGPGLGWGLSPSPHLLGRTGGFPLCSHSSSTYTALTFAPVWEVADVFMVFTAPGTPLPPATSRRATSSSATQSSWKLEYLGGQRAFEQVSGVKRLVLGFWLRMTCAPNALFT